MATNAEPVVDDNKEVTDEDWKAVKYGKDEVETSDETEEDETSESEDTGEESEEAEDEESQNEEESIDEDSEEESEEAPEFVKQFVNIKGDTAEEYAKNLEEAYKNSTAEALRLKSLATPKVEDDDSTEDSTPPVQDPRLLYVDRIVEQDIKTSYEAFRKDYPQVDDPAEYEKFTNEVRDLSTYFIQTQGRAATAGELYPKAAAILGWDKQTTVDSKDKLDMALKDRSSSSKTTSSTKPKSKQSKVSDKEVQMYKLMNPESDLTDAKIREELEVYV